MERTIILGRLLDKYEHSMHLLHPGQSNKRVMLRIDRQELPEYRYEDAAVRDRYNLAAKELASEGIISVEWLISGLRLSNVALNLDSVSMAYHLANRVHPRELAQAVCRKLNDTLGEVSTPWIQAWKDAMQDDACKHLRIPGYCRNDLAFFDGLLSVICAYDELHGRTVTIRAFSIRCFQDSKEFERTYQDEFLRIARKYCAPLAVAVLEEELGKREQLAIMGINARTELFELSGRFVLQMESGAVDLAPCFPGGIALPSTQVDRIQSFRMDSVKHITLIENKTNYEEYLQSEISLDELVVYQGGFLSPDEIILLTKLAESLPEDCDVKFWGDIDLGGFQMFDQLQSVFPTIQPMRMSAQAFDEYKDYGLQRKKEYLSHLKRYAEMGRFQCFQDVIPKILEYGVTIEQESFYL